LRFTLLLVALVLPASLLAQRSPSRDYGRSMVISRSGIVATSQTLASEAGASVLEHGGNAVDAAIADNAALGVTEPMMNGIGGDLFAIVYDAKTKKTIRTVHGRKRYEVVRAHGAALKRAIVV